MQNLRPLVNYHTHTWRCLHATGTEEEYVREAIRTGFAVLGFADHTPWPYKSDFVAGMRMRLDQLDDYLTTVRALGEKYREWISIPVGLECEAFPEYYGWLEETKARSLDYVILGNHYQLNDETGGMYYGRCTRPEQVRSYCDNTIAGMRTGLYDYVAHPDLYCHTYRRFDAECAAAARDLCDAAVALNIPLEYNLLGLQYHAADPDSGHLGYPCPQFWEIAAQRGVKAIIGLDAHHTVHLTRRDLFEQAEQTLSELGIEVLRELPLKR